MLFRDARLALVYDPFDNDERIATLLQNARLMCVPLAGLACGEDVSLWEVRALKSRNDVDVQTDVLSCASFVVLVTVRILVTRCLFVFYMHFIILFL